MFGTSENSDNEKMNHSDGWANYGIHEAKRFFQWILGCTYAKKTFRTRIAEMFHFADAPHIVVYERSEERPWYWMVGIITAILIAVLSLYYTLEAGVRSIRKFAYSVLREPAHSTVTTPRCLSPTTPSSKKTSPQTPKTPDVVRQKVPMNEPVNCVFIRPAAPKGTVAVPNLNSEEDVTMDADHRVMMATTPKKNQKEGTVKDSEKEKRDKKKSPPTMRLEEVNFDASSNVNVIPTMAPSPNVTTARADTPNRKSSGSDHLPESPIAQSSASEYDKTNEWVMKQISGCQALGNEQEVRKEGGACEVLEHQGVLEEEKDNVAAGVSGDFLRMVQELIEGQLGQSSVLETTNSSVEDLSERSASLISSLIEIESPEFEETQKSSLVSKSDVSQILKVGKEQDVDESVDIVVYDDMMTAETENECAGSILVREGQQKVLFRWKDPKPDAVDSITLTGSFVGWNINVPMKRGTKEGTFEVCMDLPPGCHDYLIHIFRFD